MAASSDENANVPRDNYLEPESPPETPENEIRYALETSNFDETKKLKMTRFFNSLLKSQRQSLSKKYQNEMMVSKTFHELQLDRLRREHKKDELQLELGFQNSVKEFRATIDKLEEEEATRKATEESENEELKKLEEISMLRKEKGDTENKKQEVQTTITNYQKEIAMLNEEVSLTTKANSSLKTRNTELRSKLKTTHQTLEHKKDLLKQKERKVVALENEKKTMEKQIESHPGDIRELKKSLSDKDQNLKPLVAQIQGNTKALEEIHCQMCDELNCMEDIIQRLQYEDSHQCGQTSPRKSEIKRYIDNQEKMKNTLQTVNASFKGIINHLKTQFTEEGLRSVSSEIRRLCVIEETSVKTAFAPMLTRRQRGEPNRMRSQSASALVSSPSRDYSKSKRVPIRTEFSIPHTILSMQVKSGANTPIPSQVESGGNTPFPFQVESGAFANIHKPTSPSTQSSNKRTSEPVVGVQGRP